MSKIRTRDATEQCEEERSCSCMHNAGGEGEAPEQQLMRWAASPLAARCSRRCKG